MQTTSRLQATSWARTGRSIARARRSRSAPTSTRSTTRSSGAPDPRRDGMTDEPCRRPALRRLQPVERRLPPQPARDGRRAAGRHRARARAPRPAGRASTRCCGRHTARTSSCLRGATARFRSSRSRRSGSLPAESSAIGISAAVFLSGAVLLGLELVASRVLAPFFGNSIFVWGALIGVVLAGLVDRVLGRRRARGPLSRAAAAARRAGARLRA